MASITRRSGSKVARFLAGVDPGASPSQLKTYAKNDGATTQLFAQSSNADIFQLTPSPLNHPVAAFVFRPGGTQEKNVYTVWSDLMAAMAVVEGPKTIYFDDSLAPIVIPAGAYNMADVIWSSPMDRGADIQIPDGVTFTDLRHLSYRVRIEYQGAGAPAPVSDLSTNEFFVMDFAASIICTGTGPFIRTIVPLVPIPVIIGMGSGATLFGTMSGGTTPCIDIQNPSFLLLAMGSVSFVEDDAISGPIGSLLIVQLQAGSSFFNPTQSAFLGTFAYMNLSKLRLDLENFVPPPTVLGSNSVSVFTAAGGTQFLPAANTIVPGETFWVKDPSFGGNTVTPSLGDTIDGVAAPYPVPVGPGIILYCDGVSNWQVF